MTNLDAWSRALPEEVSFWRYWLTTEYAKERLTVRRTDADLVAQVLDTSGPVLRILDVGAGPLTTLSASWPDRTVVVIPVDALAAEYDLLLHEAGIAPPIRTLPLHAERLTEAFPAGYFDAVNCANALDHFYDPIRAVHQMLAVTRPGGIVRVIVHENEGERQQYLGLHQWNICRDGPNVRIWNRQGVDLRWQAEFLEAVIHHQVLSDPPLLAIALRKVG